MTEQDEKDFEQCCRKFGLYPHQRFTYAALKVVFMESRRMRDEQEFIKECAMEPIKPTVNED